MKTLRLLTLVAGLTVILFSVKAQKHEHKQKTMQERFTLTDMNKDGEITLEEFKAAEKKLMEKREKKQKARFEAIDKNGDKQISIDEFLAKSRTKRRAKENKKRLNIEQRFQNLDTDKNGKVSPNEFYKQRKKQSYRKNKKHNKKYRNQK